jgi:hypothetical protein
MIRFGCYARMAGIAFIAQIADIDFQYNKALSAHQLF